MKTMHCFNYFEYISKTFDCFLAMSLAMMKYNVYIMHNNDNILLYEAIRVEKYNGTL